MNIGSIIKKMRREKDMTQEQLAEYLNVSVSAISQWESEKTMPDISLLPVISNVLNITSDYLLGIDVENNENNIQRICDEEQKLFAKGQWNESTALLREGLHTYPNSYILMTKLAGNLFCMGQLDESLELAGKVIDRCTDLSTKAEAIQYACDALSKQGKFEKAADLAKTLPEVTSDQLLCNIYEGTELSRHYRKTLLEEITYGLYHMQMLADCTDNDGSPAFTFDERVCIYTKVLKVYEILFEDNDYYYFAQFLSTVSRKIAEICVEQKQYEQALDYVKRYVKYGTMFATYPADAKFTSLMFRNMEYGGWVKDAPDYSYYDEMWAELSSDVFMPLKTMDAFQNILDRLDSHRNDAKNS